ncbi:MAG: DMT family transporter [Candidatus Aminicenantes bacterium]|nr:DMT family transporter [Candidatus Aminicenantes bacterium]
MTPRDDRRSLIEIHIAVLLFGFPGLFGKWLALPPQVIVLGRVAFAALALSFVILATKRTLRVETVSDNLLLFGCGLLLAFHWTAFFRSVQVSSVAIGLLAYSSFPVFTAFLEPLAFRERVRTSSVVLAGLCVLGIYLIVPRFEFDDATFVGVLWGLAAGLSFAILTLANRSLVKRRESTIIAFYQDVYAALALLPFVLKNLPALTGRDMGLLAVLGVACTAAAHTLFIQGMRRVKAQTASVISSLEPVYGILLALVFLGEVPAARTVAGGLVILAAALLATLSRRPARP